MDAIDSVNATLWDWSGWLPIGDIAAAWLILSTLWLAAAFWRVIRNLWDALPFT